MQTTQGTEPNVGEVVPIVRTLFGGDDPTDPWLQKIRIYAPARVEVLGKRTDIHRDSRTNEIVWEHRMVRLKDVKTGTEYPEVKMGSLLHAAGLVEEEDTEGKGFFFAEELTSRSDGVDEPLLASNPALAALQERFAREEAARQKLCEEAETVELARPLVAVAADTGDTLNLLERTGDFLKVSVQGRSPVYVVPKSDLLPAIAIP